jgi:hypothetical protein
MYIHRVVIDANRINTRGAIEAMNRLETFHDAGLVEIFQTSTLPVEFRSWPRGIDKARNYTVIGGNSMVYLTDSNVADSSLGAGAGESRFMEIHDVVFGAPASAEDVRVGNMRDALHIDQADQHDADFFVADDGAILLCHYRACRHRDHHARMPGGRLSNGDSRILRPSIRDVRSLAIGRTTEPGRAHLSRFERLRRNRIDRRGEWRNAACL